MPGADFSRIAIVNRGEPAMRLINAVREYGPEHDLPLRTIALYTEPDARAMFVREADERYALGPALYTDGEGRRRSTYLDYARLEQALVATGAEAVWVGWGFVAEHAEFADLCKRLGIVFIGPDGDTMRRVGDKITSKLLAEEADVPVAPWSGGPVASVEEAREHAARLGYPLMIKATAGGGGRGIRRVHDDAQLAEGFERARAEAAAAFGDPTLFLERMVGGARHIEVQIIGDDAGTVWAVGTRDCTIQRRNQKVLEEAPSPALDAEQDTEVRAAARRLGERSAYRNAGTVEFLYDAASRTFTFMEVNARLQVEHPVTELTTGLDMVKLQLHVARGGRLEGEPPPTVGHAIEVRLNAEDPERRFAPAPGRIELFRMPVGPGLRVDTGIEEGDVVPTEFDSMVAKLLSVGASRAEALARMQRALAQTAVVIRDGASNKAFLSDLIARPEVHSGDYDVGWLDGLVAAGRHLTRRHAEVALVQAAIDAYEARMQIARAQFLASAARGRPEVDEEVGVPVKLRYLGNMYEFRVFRMAPRHYRLEIDGDRIDAELERVGRAGARLTIGGRSYRVVSAVHGLTHQVEVEGTPHQISGDQGGIVRAPAPAVVVSVHVEPGAEVTRGTRLAVIEAMKMETALEAPFDGTVREVMIRPNVQVGTGEPLLVIEPAATDEDAAAADDAIDLSALAGAAAGPATPCHDHLRDLRRLVLGYDVPLGDLAGHVASHPSPCGDTPQAEAELRELEDEVLDIFADTAALFRRRPAEAEEGDTMRSSREYLFAYLRDLDAAGEGLPGAFVTGLRESLRHYGIDSLERTTDLEHALFRLYLAHERMPAQLAPILAIMERRLQAGPPADEAEGRRFQTLLRRLSWESRGRYEAVHSLSQEMQFRMYDEPFLAAVRDREYAEARADLAALEADPVGDEREALMAGLVACSQPLRPLISSGYHEVGRSQQANLLELITRRYYRLRNLHNIANADLGGRIAVSAEYDHEDTHFHVVTTHARWEYLAEAAAALGRHAARLPEGDAVVLDLYVRTDAADGDDDDLGLEIARVFNAPGFPRGLHRLVVAVSKPSDSLGMSSVQHFTYRPNGDGGYAEERLVRALHPMMAKRLHLWRLSEFDLTRIPSGEDVYLFHGVARDNPTDERIFALAEVRDLTPMMAATGKVIALPEFERVFLEVTTSIRHYRAGLDPRRRPVWNRIMLYVWPEVPLTPEELSGFTYKLAPATAGLGLEQVAIRAAMAVQGEEESSEWEFVVSNPDGGIAVRLRRPPTEPLGPLDEYTQNVVRLRRRGLTYPYELIKLLESGDGAAIPPGRFTEYDLPAPDAARLEPVDRPYGRNASNIIVGVVSSTTAKHPEGMNRVLIAGDPTRGMGNLAEPECRRINAALDLAEEMQIPAEWYAVSAGALISMTSGTENMDWIGATLRRIIHFTQAGGELNIVVPGINVGAQPYWNAEATMLLHTKGILIMTPGGAMVLTGKEALDYSGGVSAEDNQGIGGYERIMGPNGQAQYFARDLPDACRVLLRHYEHTYVAPGERFPRRAETTDPAGRVAGDRPHGNGFATVGEVFSEETNPGRKRPFEIRKVMAAVVDQDHEPLERWQAMQDAEIGVVWDAHLGGYPVCLLGIESTPVRRLGFVPADGPDQWTSGTLFPLSSKKVARAINAASNNRPVVVLANLSGFDGSPESMRKLQLEYGAEIGRAVVNFRGPIVFCVVSRYHGGAFVVFSQALNESMHVVALEGTHASVIGGAPAAAVVFAREVRKRAEQDPRVVALREQIASGEGDTGGLRARLADLIETVHSEKLGQVADEFDSIHSVHRAKEVGSVHEIIPPKQIRPYLIESIERGMAAELARD